MTETGYVYISVKIHESAIADVLHIVQSAMGAGNVTMEAMDTLVDIYSSIRYEQNRDSKKAN